MSQKEDDLDLVTQPGIEPTCCVGNSVGVFSCETFAAPPHHAPPWLDDNHSYSKLGQPHFIWCKFMHNMGKGGIKKNLRLSNVLFLFSSLFHF